MLGESLQAEGSVGGCVIIQGWITVTRVGVVSGQNVGCLWVTWLAQSAEHVTLDLRIMSSSHTLNVELT